MAYSQSTRASTGSVLLRSPSDSANRLSRRPCECRLKRPRILHGVGKEGGGANLQRRLQNERASGHDRPPAETRSDSPLARNGGSGERQTRYKVSGRSSVRLNNMVFGWSPLGAELREFVRTSQKA